MRPYESSLPQIFPYVIELTPSEARAVVRLLLRVDVFNGSSFAVTIDGHGGMWKIWVSETGYKYLVLLDPDLQHLWDLPS